MKFSGHAMKRLQERYGIKWTAMIEADLAAQWKAMKGRDPKAHEYGCIWYTFDLCGKGVRMLFSLYEHSDKVVITCGPAEWVNDPYGLSGKRKPKKRRGSGVAKLDNRRPRQHQVR
jgi:hypothetical protein